VHNVARANDFMGLTPPLRNFFSLSEGRGPRRTLRASTRLKDWQNEHFISPSETKRFAAHAASHWNPYARRIRHCAELFVFNGLTPFSFRRFHGLFVFNDLAPLLVSPLASSRCFSQNLPRTSGKGAFQGSIHFPTTEII